MSTKANEPYGNSRFMVEIEGVPTIDFIEVILPELSVEMVEVREGTDQTQLSRKIAKKEHLGNLTVKRGFDGSLDLSELWNYLQQGRDPKSRLSINVVLLDENDSEVARWLLANAFPVRYSFSPLNANEGNILMETMEFACEKMVLA